MIYLCDLSIILPCVNKLETADEVMMKPVKPLGHRSERTFCCLSLTKDLSPGLVSYFAWEESLVRSKRHKLYRTCISCFLNQFLLRLLHFFVVIFHKVGGKIPWSLIILFLAAAKLDSFSVTIGIVFKSVHATAELQWLSDALTKSPKSPTQGEVLHLNHQV